MKLHRAWIVGGVALVAIMGAAGFRATPGVMINPLREEFGWSSGTVSLAVSVNLVLYGVTAPFAASLMDRFGMRRVVAAALALIAAGSGLTVWMTESWQLVALWGVLVGLGTGSMALVFAATLTDRWFTRRKGLVMGVLTAGGATGQLVFLPLLAALAEGPGWRTASVVVSLAALAVVPFVWFLLRDSPEEVGLTAYGTDVPVTRVRREGAAGHALRTLREAARHRGFWYLAIGFFVCGASTNGLIGTHFIPAAHDHGMPEQAAAGLLAVIGIFDVAGTIFSGWLTDRFDPAKLLLVYYGLRGLSLLVFPTLLASGNPPSATSPGIVLFIVLYGLDWVATVPPTVALCARLFGADGAIVFGWVFASHMIGAAAAAVAAGVLRDELGAYDAAWYGSAILCLLAAGVSAALRAKRAAPGLAPEEDPDGKALTDA
ncbi:sugar phosphate permease [Actinocorallia herbida]|uniref:Sugar phosphate permease n=1 Tax=Actinocorallia herbida TaxID=58109 RepID=A0A3N1DCK2_9ACTN|nr:MFS transporter [Actinocorallia herbida]ROO91265.1 sugar phosphate permease [Actinocorallia herbida]